MGARFLSTQGGAVTKTFGSFEQTRFTIFEGATYYAELGRIEYCTLGFRNGVMTGDLGFKFYGGTGQGIGGYCLDDRPTTPNGPRTPHKSCGAWVASLLAAVGVADISEVEGMTVWALRESTTWSSPIVGVVGLDGENPMLFASLSAEDRDEVAR